MTDADEQQAARDAAAETARLPRKPATWADLLTGHTLAILSVMCGGVLIYAANLFFTAALMPTIVADIGGEKLYAWVTTAFVAAAILASLLSNALQHWRGTAVAYAIAFVLFALGAAASASAPSMGWLVAGRAVQGLGGGFMVALGYSVIRVALPRRHWARGMMAVSAMWGVGLLIGPATGGVFATLGEWRIAYWILAIAGVPLGFAARRVFASITTGGAREPFPFQSLLPLLLAIALISVSTIVPPGWPMVLTVLAGLALIGVFLYVDRRAPYTLLPALTYQPGGSLKWLYLTMAAVNGATTLENFAPLFGQELAGMTPFNAGLLAAAVAAGWVLGQSLFTTVSDATSRRVIRFGPLCMMLGFACYGLLQYQGAGNATVVVWFLSLMLVGAGGGMAWPQLGVAAMSSSEDLEQGNKAAGAISTVALLSYAVASALAGALMAFGGDSAVSAARFTSFGMLLFALVGAHAARRALRQPPATAP